MVTGCTSRAWRAWVVVAALSACGEQEAVAADQIHATLVVQTADRVWVALEATVTFEPTSALEEQSEVARTSFVIDCMRAALAHAAGQQVSAKVLAQPAVLAGAAQGYFDRLVAGFMERHAIAVMRATVHAQAPSDPLDAKPGVDIAVGASDEASRCSTTASPEERPSLLPDMGDSPISAAFGVDMHGGILKLGSEATLTVAPCTVFGRSAITFVRHEMVPKASLAEASRCYVTDLVTSTPPYGMTQATFTWHGVQGASGYTAWTYRASAWEALDATVVGDDITVRLPFAPALYLCLTKAE